MDPLPFDLPDFAAGSVWLTGAGPGDPALLTLAALHGLRAAEVVLHDDLIDDRLLDLAHPAAAVENWGKRGGRASPAQGEITQRMISLARDGRRVLRLKGGDPFVFGRGAEEALALAAAGIAFRIVPGISAATGGLAHAGIPLTAGGVNGAVALATGHGPDGGLPDDLDRVALAPVLVVFMAMSRLELLCARLIAAGRRPDEPAAVVSSAASRRQKVVEARLADLPDAARGMPAPALVVVGPVVGLRQRLDWWHPGPEAEADA